MIFDPFGGAGLITVRIIRRWKPSTLIALGTFAGDKQIVAGDVVELDIERIGTLRNRVVQSNAKWSNFAAGVPTRAVGASRQSNNVIARRARPDDAISIDDSGDCFASLAYMTVRLIRAGTAAPHNSPRSPLCAFELAT